MSDNEVKDYGIKKALVNKPLAWQDLTLSEQVKGLRFFRDSENNIVVFAVTPFDPTQTGVNVLPIGRVGISDPLTLNAYARVYGLPCCGWPETTLGLVTHSTQMVQKDANLEAVRTPTIFISAVCSTAAATIIWNPAAGRRFRLIGGTISFEKPILGAANSTTITLLDNVTATGLVFNAWIPASAASIFSIPFDLRPNGYLSIAADNDLNVTLTANLVSGNIRLTLWGTEEV